MYIIIYYTQPAICEQFSSATDSFTFISDLNSYRNKNLFTM